MVELDIMECTKCRKKCEENVIETHGKSYHISCFSCCIPNCANDLAKVGFFFACNSLYCRDDYHRLLGKKCAGCSGYVEGQAISVSTSHFHPQCFRCAFCRSEFPVGVEISFDGENYYCKTCEIIPPKRPDVPNHVYSGLSKEKEDDHDKENCNELEIAPKRPDVPAYIPSVNKKKENKENHSDVEIPPKKPEAPNYISSSSTKDEDKENRPTLDHPQSNCHPVTGLDISPVPPPPPIRKSKNALLKLRAGLSESTPELNGNLDHLELPENVNLKGGLSAASSTTSLNSDGTPKQKGVGYNQLQLRRLSQRNKRRVKLPTNVDHERLQKFLDDPDNGYLEDEEFLQVFNVTREKYYTLPKSQRQELREGILFR